MNKLPIKKFTSLLVLFFLLATRSFGLTYLQEAVEIGGIKQWISIKGADKKNPVLLFLHGGPGNSVMGYDEKFTKKLQQYFIVVQWDQRDVERTAKFNSSDKPLTVELMKNDAVEMINYLRKRFSREKIYLAGHSWGGFLGLKVASDYPDLLEAYFAISPMVWQDESERLSLQWLKNKAKEKGNSIELKELESVTIPFRTADDLYYHRKWLITEMGSKPVSKAFVDTWAVKWLPLFQEASHINFFEIAPEIECPIYFIVGSQDFQTYHKLTEDYFKMLKAEKKELFWFTNSAHSPNITESAKFQQTIIDHRILKN